uniref:Uncharacterized protein n=1 Tax=Percolomonas cosmopolitus TaxID=63605 RepID=A0A7S1PJN7_9EUKA
MSPHLHPSQKPTPFHTNIYSASQYHNPEFSLENEIIRDAQKGTIVEFHDLNEFDYRIQKLDEILLEKERQCESEASRCMKLVSQFIDFLYCWHVKGLDVQLPLLSQTKRNTDLSSSESSPDTKMFSMSLMDQALTDNQKLESLTNYWEQQVHNGKQSIRMEIQRMQEQYRSMKAAQIKMLDARNISGKGNLLSVFVHKQQFCALNDPNILCNVLSFAPMRGILSMMQTCSVLSHFIPQFVPLTIHQTMWSFNRENGFTAFMDKWKQVRHFITAYAFYPSHLKLLRDMIEKHPCMTIQIEDRIKITDETLNTVLSLPLSSSLNVDVSDLRFLSTVDPKKLKPFLSRFDTLKVTDLDRHSLGFRDDIDQAATRQIESLFQMMDIKSLHIVDHRSNLNIVSMFPNLKTLSSEKSSPLVWSEIKTRSELEHLTINRMEEDCRGRGGSQLKLKTLTVRNVTHLWCLEGSSISCASLAIFVERFKFPDINELANIVDSAVVQEINLHRCDVLGENYQYFSDLLATFPNVKLLRIHCFGCSIYEHCGRALYNFMQCLPKGVCMDFVFGTIPRGLIISVLKQMALLCDHPERILFQGDPIADTDIRDCPRREICVLCGQRISRFHTNEPRACEQSCRLVLLESGCYWNKKGLDKVDLYDKKSVEHFARRIADGLCSSKRRKRYEEEVHFKSRKKANVAVGSGKT